MKKTYRVAQWGTGNVGRRALGAVIDHPRMELAAVRVFAEEKAGADAGSLCGRGETGVIATRSIDEVVAARPDCTIYMPDHADIGDMVRLLEAGSNIVTGVIGFNHRGSLSPDDRERLEAACAKGATSLFSTGSAPGWSTETIPLALLMTQRRLDCLTITDYADNSLRDSPLMLFDLLGFGKDPATFAGRKTGTAASTPPSFRALTEMIGLPIDDIETTVEYAVTRKREVIAAGTIEAGTIGALRMGVIGLRRGKPLIRRFSLWYVSRDIEPAWELRDSGWRIQVAGDASLDVSIGFDVAQEDFAAFTPGLTANPLINVLPYVCAAAPGILHTGDLPTIVPDLGEA